MGSGLVQVTDATFKNLVPHAPVRTTVLDFWSSSCRPCLELDRILQGLIPELPPDVDVFGVSTDDNPELVRRFDVLAAPTLVILRGGEPVTRLTGVDRPQVIRRAIQGASGSAAR